ncbi:MAG: hypothetical protein LUF87_08710 [Alistipes sp.]|nr:hypothetical protein [Alistipes sp.]MCD7970421.1 hypothetical protein [Alistipes sp.]
MKRIVILTLGLGFIMCSINRSIDVSHRIYTDEDSLKLRILDFINDSLCIYTQEYLVEMPEEFQRVEIICKFWKNNHYIILEPLDCPIFLKGVSCFILPDSVRNLFKAPQFQGIDRLMSFDERGYYGFLDGIKDKDTLQIVGRDIYYFKNIPCHTEEMYSWPSIRKFTEKGENDKNKKRLRETWIYYNNE